MAQPPDDLIEVFAKPFGPFREEVLLPRLKSTHDRPIELKDLSFECQGFLTGLDHTELYFAKAMSLVKSQTLKGTELETLDSLNTRFRGVLALEDISFLSDEAQDIIGEVYCDRFRSINGAKPKKGASVVLRRYPRLRLLVCIQADRAKPATYLPTKGTYNLRLLVQSATRTYVVTSMGKTTYHFSSTYLSRYDTLATLQHVVQSEDYRDTPQSERTPEWYLERFLEPNIPRPSFTRWEQRTTFIAAEDSDDGDGDFEIRLPSLHQDASESSERRPSSEDIRSILALVAEWLVAWQGELKRHKLIDLTSWRKLAAGDPQYRSWTKRIESQRWTPSNESSDSREEAPRRSEREISPDAPASSSRHYPRRKRLRMMSPDEQEEASQVEKPRDEPKQWPSDIIDVDALDGTPEPTDETNEAVLFTSESNTSGPARPETYTLADEVTALVSDLPLNPLNPSLRPSFPLALCRPPVVSASLEWTCPVPRCTYAINADELIAKRLDTEYGDPLLVATLNVLVSRHNEEHLAALGFSVPALVRKRGA